MPPRRSRSSSRAASTSRRRRREPTQSPPPSPLPWELPLPDQTNRYRALHKRDVDPSKFFDAYTIHNLGLRDEVNEFVTSVGWTHFAGLSFPTYRFLTYEFLSTLRSSYHPHVIGDPVCINFRLLGEDRELRMSQLNAIFGFPDGGVAYFHPDFIAHLAWQQLSSDPHPYNPSSSKSSYLRNHALRYIHRVMVLSLFGRGLSRGVVSKVELLFLWAMVNEVPVNTGAWLLRHLLHVAKSTSGNIRVGGIITVIAHAFGFVPIADVHHKVEGSNLVDIDTLINMRMCRHIGGGLYRLLDDGGHIIEPQAEGQQEEEEPAPQEEGQQEEEQMPAQEEDDIQVDMSGFMGQASEPPPDWQMTQLVERFDRLEARMDRSEEMQRQRFDSLEGRMIRDEEMRTQMLRLLQQNADAMARMEDRFNNLK